MRFGLYGKRIAALTMCLVLTGCGAAGEVPAPAEQTQTDAGTQEDSAGSVDQTSDQSDGQSAAATDTASAADSGETTEQAAAQDESLMESEDVTTTDLSKLFRKMQVRSAPESEAFTFVLSFGPGINLGNTFDAYNDGGIAADLSNEMMTETFWQTTPTSKEVIQTLADAGFKTIRIPVSWHNHLTGDDLTISPVFLDRVQEVVDWSLDAGMKVILNIHHDNHPEAGGFYPDSAHKEQSRRYISRIWQQLAERFRDYDERLIFEAMNEPRLVGQGEEWWFDAEEPSDAAKDAIACTNELNQLFVDTVRGVDGKHRNCYLMCPGYDASPDGVLTDGFVVPTDADDVKDHIILSVHSYAPYAFALEEGGTPEFDSFSSEDTAQINAFMYKLYLKYVFKGIPVVIDEFGSRDRGGNVAARADHAAFFTACAWSNSIPCLWWDNNNFYGSGEEFAIYDRANLKFSVPEIRDAILANAVVR